MDRTDSLESVREYYGQVLKSSADLKTSACCAIEAIPSHLRGIVDRIHTEVKEKFYGCGTPIPPELEGRVVLDLGSGTGRDCFLLSKLVGPHGRVIGIDMTEEQLEVANRHIDYHTREFGYPTPNVSFRKGYIEDLKGAGIADQSVDVVISNCVVNLSPDKPRVLAEIFRVLRPGGELFYSDVFSNRRIPAHLASDPQLRGECLGGAFYTEDFRRTMARVGFSDFRVVSKQPIALNNAEIERKVGMISFSSITTRAFKLNLEDRCEDYGQVAYYLGTIENAPHEFSLDDHHHFRTGMPMLVCSNTAAMLGKTRYAPHFKVVGDLSTHFGLFDCAPAPAAGLETPAGACC